MPSTPSTWSERDADGIRTQILGTGAKSTLRGRRLRRADQIDLNSTALWPEEYRVLLREWLAGESTRTKFPTLIKVAGHARRELAQQLVRVLLHGGWVEIEEHRSEGVWRLSWVRFLDIDRLRGLVGLVDKGAATTRLEELKGQPLHAPSLVAMRRSIDRLSVSLALRRMRLLLAFDEWIRERRFGTRRDFALHVSGNTKGIPDSDWAWLETELNLEDQGIRRHVPLLLLRAPWVLHGRGAIDLRGVPDCMGLSQQTLEGIYEIEGQFESWCLIENRTLFDRVAAAYGDRHAVLWLPGNPPLWWKLTVAHLLKLRPAPARIACDPDPAGIQIAVAAGELWQQQRQSWRPWGMSVASIRSLQTHSPLTDEDDTILDTLQGRNLSPELTEAANWMRTLRLKGEQEGLSLQTLELDGQQCLDPRPCAHSLPHG
ncbi:MAG: hypothetical protein JWO52_5647 [Gammaproteobacteria bacterium]|nr:hypothetical protein [Gammaproteobacteria bacterium]